MTTASSAVVPDPVVVTPELLAQHSITPDEYERILTALGRVPSLTELGIYSVMWSEHCSYKSSRVHLKRLPTKSDRVVQGPGENAGIIDVGDGWACAFKIESHNHPSYIEPFQGAATGVGGILRDIFTMGARPLAVMDSLRFGPIQPESRREPELVAEESLHRGRRGQRHRRIRQLLRRAESRRRDEVRALLQRQSAGECVCARHGAQGRDLLRQGHGHRQPGDLCRRKDRPRRHSWRHHGQRGIQGRLRSRSGPTCRWAIRSWRSCCSRPAWKP